MILMLSVMMTLVTCDTPLAADSAMLLCSV